MGSVIAFPGAAKSVAPVEEQVPVEEAVEPAPKETKPPVYVRVRADVFMEMMNAVSFYMGQGFDHGRRAARVMNQLRQEQPT